MLTETHFTALVEGIFGSKYYPEILELYDVKTNKYRNVLSEIIGDTLFHCPSRYTALALSDLGIPVYTYYFKYLSKDMILMQFLGVCHGCDLP